MRKFRAQISTSSGTTTFAVMLWTIVATQKWLSWKNGLSWKVGSTHHFKLSVSIILSKTPTFVSLNDSIKWFTWVQKSIKWFKSVKTIWTDLNHLIDSLLQFIDLKLNDSCTLMISLNHLNRFKQSTSMNQFQNSIINSSLIPFNDSNQLKLSTLMNHQKSLFVCINDSVQTIHFSELIQYSMTN